MDVKRPLKNRNLVFKSLAICVCLSMVMTEVSFADSLTDKYWKENQGVIPTSQNNLQAAPFGPDESTRTNAYTVIGCGGDEAESQYQGGCDGYFTDTKKFIFGDWRVVKRAQTSAWFVPGWNMFSGPGIYEATYEYARDSAGRVYGSKATVDLIPKAQGYYSYILQYSLAYTTNLLGQVIGTVYLSSWLNIFGSNGYETLYNQDGSLKSPTRSLVKDANGNFVLPSTLTSSTLTNVVNPVSGNTTVQSTLRQSLSIVVLIAQSMSYRQNKNDSAFFTDPQSNNGAIDQIRSFFSALFTFISSFNNSLKDNHLNNSSTLAATAPATSDTSLRSQILNKSSNDLEDQGLSINTNASAAPIENTPIRTGELSVADNMDRGKVKVSFDISNMDEVSVHGANIKDMASPTPRGPSVALTDADLLMSPGMDNADDTKTKRSILNEAFFTSYLDSRVTALGAMDAGVNSKDQSSSSSFSMSMEAYLSGVSPVSKSLDRLLKKNPTLSIDAMMVKLARDPESLDENPSLFSVYSQEDSFASKAGTYLPAVAA